MSYSHKIAEDVFEERNGHKPPKKARKKDEIGDTKRIADAILETNHFAQDAGGKLWRFSEGVYKPDGERYVGQQVKALLNAWGETPLWSTTRAKEVVAYIAVDAPELWEHPPLNEINVLNGLLNVETRELRNHSPAFLSPVQLPVKYDPDATCPAWDEFVAETFPEDARGLAYEIPAWLMTPDTSIHKAILALGEGRNGKGRYSAALAAFIGRRNKVSMSLQKIETDRFAAARLVGKLANICPDLPSTHLTSTSTFKALTGGDEIDAEYKYRDSFDFRPFARLVFSANHAPRSSDGSYAFFQRWVVIPFNRTFEEHEQIAPRILDARLADARELSGVLNKALDALPRIRARGFTQSKSTTEALEEFRQTTDPLAVWLNRHTVERAEAFVSKDELASKYNAACEKAGRPGLDKKALGRQLKRLRPNITDSQRTWRGKPNTWVWVGLGIKDDGGGDDEPPDGGDDGGGNEKTENNGNNGNPFIVKNSGSRGVEGQKQEEITNREKFVASVVPVAEGRRRLTEEEAIEVQKLISQGMDAKLARAAVLGEDPGLV